ncbi:MAG: DUF6427 family protein [Bacteroidota bacterium]
MIYSTFGTNRPIVLALLVIPAVALVIVAAFATLPVEYPLGGPATDALMGWFGGSEILRRIVGMVLITVNAAILNSLYNRHDFATNENHYPALIYLFLVGINFDNIDIQPALFASLFILLALRRLLLVYRAENVLSIGFDSALFLSLGILFYPPAAILMLLPWLVFIQVRPFNLKEWVVPFTGIALVAIYVFSYYFLGEHSFVPYEFFDLGIDQFTLLNSETSWFYYLLLICLLLLTIIGLASFLKEVPKSNLRKKSTKYIFLWLTLLLGIGTLYSIFLEAGVSNNFVLLAIPFSVFSGALFSVKARRPMLPVIMFYSWFACSILYAIFSN